MSSIQIRSASKLELLVHAPDLIDQLRTTVANPLARSSDYDLNPDVVLPEGRKLRDAAVLIPIWERVDGLHLILTKRASGMKHHPGQIAFPGGKRDDGDDSLHATALREAREEIALPPTHVEIFGDLPVHETVTSFKVQPVLGLIRDDFTPMAEPGEVAEVFTVPLPHVLDPANYLIEGRRWRGVRRRYFAVPYGPYYIWGATARILRSLAGPMAL
ncbi:CoA pyrophosphatase [Cognatishimia sp. MH4019]|uniref:CoA pyrophosphatase n=1 Tax=Cognatishimia sp. MH4019 TaxID=2854030 RepID=UPI001CD76632|nr:CoA pyrophosphatase [Cognatishimia sp. MH4019]